MKAVFWKMFSLCRFLPDAPFDLFLLDDPCEPLSELPLSTLSLNLLPELRERRSLLSVLSGSKPCACWGVPCLLPNYSSMLSKSWFSESTLYKFMWEGKSLLRDCRLSTYWSLPSEDSSWFSISLSSSSLIILCSSRLILLEATLFSSNIFIGLDFILSSFSDKSVMISL